MNLTSSYYSQGVIYTIANDTRSAYVRVLLRVNDNSNSPIHIDKIVTLANSSGKIIVKGNMPDKYTYKDINVLVHNVDVSTGITTRTKRLSTEEVSLFFNDADYINNQITAFFKEFTECTN